MRISKRTLALSVAVLAGVMLAGCGPAFIRRPLPRRPAQEDTRRIEAGGAQAVRARLNMGVGRLKVSGGAPVLMTADFQYPSEEWKPSVAYSVEGTAGVLSVRQDDMSGPRFRRTDRNEWDVRLSDEIPLDLDIELGVGESDLELGSLTLRRLEVRGGAGKTTVDLSGTPKADLRAEIESGVGELRLKVPAEAGVRVTGVSSGIGDWKAEGFTSRPGDRDAVYNAAYDTAKVRYDIRLIRGVGSIRIEQ
jgi:hypothetical protein